MILQIKKPETVTPMPQARCDSTEQHTFKPSRITLLFSPDKRETYLAFISVQIKKKMHFFVPLCKNTLKGLPHHLQKTTLD